jgi:16S rRNA (guanine527-N7)-methyltransferase
MLPADQALAPEDFRAILERRAPDFDVRLSPFASRLLAGFLAELDIARRQTNLTGPISAEELVGHALESAFGERLIPHGAHVIDIGSGAGFPGVPLAIARADLRVTPVEPRKKRRAFLAEVRSSLPVANLAPPEPDLGGLPPASVDAATVRAVGGIEKILGRAPFLKKTGLFLAWTTEPLVLAGLLAPGFSPDTVLAVPESERKVIASFRRTAADVPRGTSRN